MSAVIVNSGPDIKTRCTDIPDMCFIAAAIANSGTEIGNHSSAIVSASRMARLRKVIAATLPRPILIYVASKKNAPPAARLAATMPCLILIFCRLKEEWFRLQWSSLH